jgi:B9 domain-containing protein 2
MAERITQFFVGGAPRLRMEEVIYSPGDRFRLQTAAAGVVHLQVGRCLAAENLRI